MKLVTKELEKKFAKYPLYSQDGKGKDAEVLVKYFNPYGVGTWLVLEAEKQDTGKYDFFGLVDMGFGYEYGYFTQEQLEGLRVPMMRGLRATEPIERDMYEDGKKVSDYGIA